MEDWITAKLGDICEVVRGGSPRPIMDFITESPDSVNWLKIGDVSEHDKYFTHSAERIKKSGIVKSREVRKGDLILSNSMSFGRVFITLIDGYIHDGWLRLRNNEDLLDREYLYYFLSSNLAKNQFNAIATGSVVNNLKSDTVKAVNIDLPQLAVQRSIAAILSALDDKIANNSKINHHLEQIAQVAFERLIIEESIDEPLGILSDIAEINPPRSLKQGNTAVYIEMANLPTRSSFPKDWTTRPYAGGMKFANGDTIMARITPCLENGKTAYINFLDKGTVAFGSTEYIVITSKAGYCNEMFYFLARYPDFINYAVRNMNGSSGRQRVSGDTIERYELHLPTNDSICAFSKIAAPIMDAIRQNALESRNLVALRDTLLPRLMSGELSVAVIGDAK